MLDDALLIVFFFSKRLLMILILFLDCYTIILNYGGSSINIKFLTRIFINIDERFRGH